jgi:hypothetical protein
MTTTFRNRPFDFLANKNNPLGLVKPFIKDGKVYELLGFFHLLSGKELNAPVIGNLPRTGYRSSVKWLAGTNDDGTDHEKFIPDSVRKFELQLKNFGLNIQELFTFEGGCGFTFIFKIHRQPISFKTVVTNSCKQAIWDFLNVNENVPEILTPNALAKKIANSAENKIQKSNSFWEQGFNKKVFKSLLHRDIVETKGWTVEERMALIDKSENDGKDTIFELNSDYKVVGKRLNLDLLEMQEKIVSQAKRKGGFVDFTYNEITYKIPKLPLMIWATKYATGKVRELVANKTVFNKETWYTVCPENLKTTDDARIHSDWWIGSGFPFEVYKLYQDKYAHQAFNKALSEFSMSLIGKNTLNDVVFLAGRDLAPVTGNVVIHPESLDTFNEDDIIVLPSGGVEFDSYIKKACKNGKGAVIVEVGNKVAHLTIVSNEYNNKGFGFRLIMLPNASELLIEAKTACVDPKNEKITPNV